jgi:glyoxylase I family protein
MTSSSPPLPLQPINHISFEVSDTKKSADFYCDVLGFKQIPRPDFDVRFDSIQLNELQFDGAWLYGHTILVHLIEGSPPERIKGTNLHLKLIQVDPHPDISFENHVAFTANDIASAESLLDAHGIKYWKQYLEEVGATQLFFKDPDGNVIEVSDCSPPVGWTKCLSGSSDV